MNNDLEFQVKYKQQTFTFRDGSEAYIFHTGILNDFDRKHGLKALSEYVEFIQFCYLKDSNRTPLGALADYVAQNWKKVKQLDKYELLDRFYSQDGGY